MFARLANGNAGPVRVIEGQGTKLSRTMHGIAYDAVHDEIIVPVHLAGAILVFRAGASGEEAPIRIIQGPHTRILRPETVELDLKNNEIVIGEDGGKDVMFFPREANGDVAPLRTIRGPKTGLDEVRSVAVDPVRNLLVVSSRSAQERPGFLSLTARMMGTCRRARSLADRNRASCASARCRSIPNRGRFLSR